MHQNSTPAEGLSKEVARRCETNNRGYTASKKPSCYYNGIVPLGDRCLVLGSRNACALSAKTAARNIKIDQTFSKPSRVVLLDFRKGKASLAGLGDTNEVAKNTTSMNALTAQADPALEGIAHGTHYFFLNLYHWRERFEEQTCTPYIRIDDGQRQSLEMGSEERLVPLICQETGTCPAPLLKLVWFIIQRRRK